MSITLGHSPAVIGNNLTIAVQAPNGKLIQAVKCTLDGLGLSDEPHINPAVAQHSHDHLQAGGSSPLQHHVHKVTVTFDDATQEFGQQDWHDAARQQRKHGGKAKAKKAGK